MVTDIPFGPGNGESILRIFRAAGYTIISPPSPMTSETAPARLAEINVARKALDAERMALEPLVSQPEVIPVLHYWRYGRRVEEPSIYGTAADAMRYLITGSEEGFLYRIGVSVGGYLITDPDDLGVDEDNPYG